MKFWEESWEKAPLLSRATKERRNFFAGLFELETLKEVARKKVHAVHGNLAKYLQLGPMNPYHWVPYHV